MSSPDNLIKDSDRPFDMITYMDHGSLVIPAGGGLGATMSVPHSRLFTPLPVGTWSTDPVFSTSKECFFSGWEGVDPNLPYVTVKTDSTNLVVSGLNPTGADIVAYWRVYGFMPSDVNVDAPYTASLADKFQSNSDYNYTKLLLPGVALAGTSPTVHHGLGKRPQVLAWIKSGGYIEQLNVSGYVKANTSDVIIINPSNDIHYRIYADSQL
jgi:hypothetical protein